MAQLVVRNLEEKVKLRLKRRAARHRRSLEEEVREILRHATKDSAQPVAGLGTLIARRFAGIGLGKTPEWRGEKARPARFK
jgi:plasmid stability protein